MRLTILACATVLALTLAGCGEATCHDLCEKSLECDTPLVQGNCHETCDVPGADEMCQANYDCLTAASCDEIWDGKCNNITCP